ncbi:host attachment family protein [Luteimonas vadosa]|uniref:Host attachment protein n=1 Tax=Luteimonas vadosa TaxID=1165507 RepID=A0ABP9DT76_9GAMM
MDKIPEGAWVVVADGEGARLFQNTGKGGRVSLQQQELLAPSDLEHEGPSGVAPPEQTGQQTDEATFAKQLANQLNAAALDNAYDHLVLVADPQTLGQMRPLLHKETLRRQVGELAKTWTNTPLEDIERSLS